MSGQGINHPGAYVPDGSGRDRFVQDCGTRLVGKVGYNCAVDSPTITPRSPRKSMHDPVVADTRVLQTCGFETLRASQEWANTPRTASMYSTLYNRNWDEP